jgi:transcription antitermination factor NusG
MARLWYVVHTYGGKEFDANINILRQGFDVVVPVELRPIKRQRPRYKPLFQNYIFVIFDVLVDPWQPIMHTYGVRRVLCYAPGRPQAIDTKFVESLIQHSIPVPGAKRLVNIGCTAVVKRGHLVNREGICSWRDGDRVKLLMHVMSNEVEVEFDIADVAPV